MTPFKTLTDLSQKIDHTLLKAEALESDIERLCHEALEYSFYAVCVNPIFVPLCVRILKGSAVKVATVCGFPLGANSTAVKRYEAHESVLAGAHEVDMVLSIGALKAGDDQAVLQDIGAVKSGCGAAALKVILETSLLTDAEIKRACQLSKDAGADFVKTSTGFASGGATGSGATEAVVRLMRTEVGPHLGVKASGGIRTLTQAAAMVNAGASRLGTSSGATLVNELKQELRNAGH